MISFIKNILQKLLGKPPADQPDSGKKEPEKAEKDPRKDDDTPEGMYPLW